MTQKENGRPSAARFSVPPFADDFGHAGLGHFVANNLT